MNKYGYYYRYLWFKVQMYIYLAALNETAGG